MNKIQLASLPRAIEPASQWLELQAREGGPAIEGSQDPDSWRRFRRPAIGADFPHSRNDVHFFGPDVPFADLQLLVAYTAFGRLNSLYMRYGSRWDEIELPEEMTGTGTVVPSLRLKFDDRPSRDKFMRAVRRLAARGKIKLRGQPIAIDIDE